MLADTPEQCPRCTGSYIATVLWGMPDFSEDLERRLEEGSGRTRVAAASHSTILTAIAACVTTNGEFDAPLETVQVNDTGHQRGQQRWLWVTRPDSYLDENGSDRDDLDPGIAPDAGDWWTCHKDTGRGDLVLLYRTRPRSDIAYVLRAESEAYPLEGDEYAMERGWDYGCDYRVLYKFRKPLTLADLRSDSYH